jgi:hypothetical protein
MLLTKSVPETVISWTTSVTFLLVILRIVANPRKFKLLLWRHSLSPSFNEDAY